MCIRDSSPTCGFWLISGSVGTSSGIASGDSFCVSVVLVVSATALVVSLPLLLPQAVNAMEDMMVNSIILLFFICVRAPLLITFIILLKESI